MLLYAAESSAYSANAVNVVRATQDTTEQYVEGLPDAGEVRREYVALLITSSWCPAATNPEGIAATRELINMHAERAEERNAVFVRQAIVLDWNVQEGYDVAQSFGTFDEVSIGRNWINESAMTHIWNRDTAVPSVPQVVVFTRDIVVREQQNGFEYTNLNHEATYKGLRAIERAVPNL